MIPLRIPVAPLVLTAFTAALPAQAIDANMGLFAGAAGVLAVDQQTGAPGQLLTKDPGYFTSPPLPRPGVPDFRTSSLTQGVPGLQIDAFSIGEDWIVSNEIGETRGPEGRWAALLFSVTRTTPGLAGGQVNYEYTNPGGAAGDLFSYEFKGSSTASLTQDQVWRVLDASDINIQPTTGTANMTAYDWFAWQYSAGLEPRKGLTAYFSVSGTTAAAVPMSWCGGDASLKSGATVFQTTWLPAKPGNPGAWSRPAVYLAPGDLGLGALTATADVDALAVDTLHHFNHYILYSIANPPATLASIRFLNRGTGYADTYRFTGGASVESRLGLGTGGDVDALCAGDPDYDSRSVLHGRTVTAPSGWPQLGNISCVVDRWPGTQDLHGFSASPVPGATHAWYVRYPALSPQPIGPFGYSQPSHFVQPVSTSLLGQRVEFGVIETATGTASRFVGIDERRERERTVVAPARFADTEGGTSGNIWRNGLNRVQCAYDTSHFTAQGIDHPIWIHEIAWRQSGAPGPSVTWPAVDVYAGDAATDYAALDPTFSVNRFVQNPSPNYSGPVTLAPAWGIQPSSCAIRVRLTTPCLYDPSLGRDLLIEIVIASAPSPSNTTLIGTSYNNGSSTLSPDHRANTMRSVGSTTALTGTVSAFCPVCEFAWLEPADMARTTEYGAGCYRRPRSFYERFASGAFDLGAAPNSIVTTTSLLLTPASGGYAVSAGSNGWWTPQGAGLGMVDDEARVRPLPQPFNTPLGPTNALTIYSNGFVLPWGSTYVMGVPPTAQELLSGPLRYAACWTDLEPDGPVTNTANVYEDAVGSMYYVTWLGVPTYTATPLLLPPGNVTMQIAFNLANGQVEYRWQNCRVPLPSLVGWSPGGNALDPGNADLDVLPIAAGDDSPGLRLAAASRAVLGTTMHFTVTTNPSAFAFLHIMALASIAPLDLAFLGMPGCQLHVDTATSAWYTLTGGPSATLPFAIPSSPTLIGFELDHQAVGFVPGQNPFGALTSNALRTIVGSQ